MLGILVLILIGRAFRKKAVAKGLPKGKWTAIGVFSYLIPYLIVGIAAVVATEERFAALAGIPAGAIVCAIAFQGLKNKPDGTPEDFKDFGTAPKDKNFEEPV